MQSDIVLSPDGAKMEMSGHTWEKPLDELLPPLPFLPPSLRWMSRDQQNFLFEFPPTRYIVELTRPGGRSWTEKEKKFKGKIQFPTPWLVWLVDPHDLTVFARPYQLQNLESDQLYWSHLPHVKDGGHQCGGYEGSPFLPKNPTPIETALARINFYWHSGFGSYWYISPKVPKQLKKLGVSHADFLSLEILHKLEKVSPEELIGWDWEQAMTIGDLLKKPRAQENNYHTSLCHRMSQKIR